MTTTTPPRRCPRLFLAVCCLAAPLVGGSAVVTAAGRPPNIVLMISDDHAWADYSFMGHPQIATPNLDRLAAQSLTFTRGYTPVPLCRPSLASVRICWPKHMRTPRRCAASARPLVNLWMSPVESSSV